MNLVLQTVMDSAKGIKQTTSLFSFLMKQVVISRFLPT